MSDDEGEDNRAAKRFKMSVRTPSKTPLKAKSPGKSQSGNAPTAGIQTKQVSAPVVEDIWYWRCKV